MSNFRFMVLVALVWGVSLELPAQDQAYVNRGTPQREGRTWVETAQCGAPARAGGRLVLRSDFGSVTVRPGTPGRAECQVRIRAYTENEEDAKRLFRGYELGIRLAEAGRILITGKLPGEFHWRRGVSVHYNISTPSKFNLDIDTNAGDLNVGNLDGELRAETAGGDIQGGDISGPVHVETKGGDIDLGVIGHRLEARTAGGSVRVVEVKGDAVMETSGGEIAAGMIEGSVSAETAGGDIVLRGASGPVRAETAGGQIQIGLCGSSIRAETAGGSIRLQGARGVVEAETAGGSIDLFRMQSAVRADTSAGRILAEILANRETFAASHLETSVGDIDVYLPTNLPMTIDAAIEEAFGHQIVSDFPWRVEGQEDGFPRRTRRAEVTLNGGGKVLRIRTTMGNIEIHKVDSPALIEMKRRQEAFWNRWQQYWESRSKVRPKQSDKQD